MCWFIMIVVTWCLETNVKIKIKRDENINKRQPQI